MRGAIKHIILFVLALIVVLLIVIPVIRRMEPHRDVVPNAHDTTRVAPPPAEKPSQVIDERDDVPGEWRTVNLWQGTGAKTPPLFTIRGRQWRIVWFTEVTEKSSPGSFEIQLFDSQGALKSTITNATSTPDRGVTVLIGPGAFSIAIKTQQKWEVRVEEKI